MAETALLGLARARLCSDNSRNPLISTAGERTPFLLSCSPEVAPTAETHLKLGGGVPYYRVESTVGKWSLASQACPGGGYTQSSPWGMSFGEELGVMEERKMEE